MILDVEYLMKKLFFLIFVVTFAVSVTSCSDDSSDESSDCVDVSTTYTYTIIDTDQTTCYNSTSGASEDCSGSGQDGEYTGIQTSYSLCSDNSVVIDNNTGLMWQASSDTDGVDGLDDDDKMTYSDGTSYCSDLTLDGYSDWRLPSIKELYSIYLMSGQDISGLTGATTNGTYVDTTGYPSFIDTDYFDVGYGDTDAGERIIDGQYLSSTVNVSQVYSTISSGYVDAFFGLNYVDGHLKSYEKDASGMNTATYYVRCVRGNTSYGVNDFEDNSDGTITDHATNLMWQQDDISTSEFDDAITQCAGSSTGGYSDWRVPNIKELHSIVDYTESPGYTSNPALDTDYFNITTGLKNEEGDDDYPYYWSSTALVGSSGKGDSAAYLTFGRGMGYIDGTGFLDVHGAGAQRGDFKDPSVQAANSDSYAADANSSFGGTTAYSSGPQGDIRRAGFNYVRCVRDP
jgi:hypothetical protein